MRGLGLYLLLTLFIAMTAQGQRKSSLKQFEKAELELRTRNFGGAIEILENIIEKEPTYGDPYLRLAVTYSVLQETDLALKYYNQYTKVVPKSKIPSGLWLTISNLNFIKGEYTTASSAILNVNRLELNNNQQQLFDLLDASILFSLEAIKLKKIIEITKLPDEINQFSLQYFPVLTVDEQMMIFTALEDQDEDLMVSYKVNDNWQPATSLSPAINSNYNEGACTISADGRTLIFTSCDGRRTLGSCDLFICYREGNEWSKPENLGEKVNSSAWDSQPALSADGRTLYFSSNRPGGFGNRDIWVSTYDGKSWGKPINLGKTINTPFEDITPFIHVNNQSLFFTSKGHPGLGGYDLYVSNLTGDGWSEPVNLGVPINSHEDEVGLFITADGLSAYFSKEQSTQGRVSSSQIMKFSMEKDTLVSSQSSYVTGIVMDAESLQPLKANFFMADLNDPGSRYEVVSDSITGKYFLVLTQGHEYGVFISRENYLFEDMSFKAEANTPLTPDTVDILLKPIKDGASLILKNVYFDFNDYTLDQRSLSELDQVFRFLTQHSKVKVRIEGYTDNIGTEDYNTDLSTKRARTVYNYLREKGLDQDQLSYQGYGSMKPVASNDTEEGRTQNRRIEFRIIEVLH